MPNRNVTETVFDISEDPGDIYFCTPCKMDFRRIEDINVHLKQKDHKRNKRYEQKIYNRRFFGSGVVEQGPLLMSEPESSEEEDETTKYEREARLRNNLCIHKGYGFSCSTCVEKRIDMEENGKFDLEKIGKHLETVYHRMVEEYGDDISLPSSCSDDLGEDIFEKADALVKSLDEYGEDGLGKKDQEEEGGKKPEEVKDSDSMEDLRSRFSEMLQDPESGYDTKLPRVVSIDGEELIKLDKEGEEEENNGIIDDPFQPVGGIVPSKYETMRGKIRFSNNIKKIPL